MAVLIGQMMLGGEVSLARVMPAFVERYPELAVEASFTDRLVDLIEEGYDLAVRMGTSAPTASRAVDALDELGLVDRKPDPGDRRALQLDLTPEGRRSVEERKARVLEAFRPAVGELPAADREQLAALLARLADELA